MVDNNTCKKVPLLWLLVLCCPSTSCAQPMDPIASQYKANQRLLAKLLADYPLAQRKKIKRHLRKEAKRRSFHIPYLKDKTKHLVEVEIRTYYQQGITNKKDLFQQERFKKVYPQTMSAIRKRLSQEIRDELILHAQLTKLLLLRDPSPQAVLGQANQQRSTSKKAPRLVRFFQLVYYTDNDDLTRLYQAVEKVAEHGKRLEKLHRLLREDVLEDTYPIEYGNVKDIQGHAVFTLEDIPPDIREALRLSPHTPPTTGMMSPPHPFTDANGTQAQRLIFVQESTFPHPHDDYTTKEGAYTIAQQKKKLNAWWKKYRDETTE